MAGHKDIGALQSGSGPDIGPLQSASGSTPLTETLTDTISLSDALVTGLGLLLSDTFTFSDSVQLTAIAIDVTIQDGSWVNVLSDTQQYEVDYFIPFTDTLALLDSVQIDLDFTFTGDSVSLSDALSENVGIPLSFSDDFTFSDAIVTYIGGSLVESFSDTLSLSDAVSKQLSGMLEVICGIYGTPLLFQPNAEFGGPPPDNFVFVDTLNLLMQSFYSFSDILALSDNVAIQVQVTFLALTETLSDTLSLSDSLSLLGGTPLTFSDTLSLSDSITVQPIPDTISLQLSDDFAFSDSYGLLMVGNEIIASIQDSLYLSDSIDVLLTESFNSYIRRYLNDVV